MAPVRAVHLVGYSGFIFGAREGDWCCIFLKRAKHFDDARTSVESLFTKSKDSLITGHAQVQSYKERFKECDKQWT